MDRTNGSASSHGRLHIVLVPGFGGFDALGQVEYYSGITNLFDHWKTRDTPAVLHYFDNLPTAAVVTRAERLRKYLAKRIARGEILPDDTLVLVGHSTGGLDIRQLIWDLHEDANQQTLVDGGIPVESEQIRECLKGVVFLSVPHWGTNIADWVCSHAALRAMIVRELRALAAGSQVYLLDQIESRLTADAAILTDAEILLALKDCLTEANAYYGKPSATRTADAEEAASELELYFRLMSSDFHVINDLAAKSQGPKWKSPAHFDKEERERELTLWRKSGIHALSYMTIGGRAFEFPSGYPAPPWELTDLCSDLKVANQTQSTKGMDLSYRLCYRACAGGPLDWPEQPVDTWRVFGQGPPEPLELWDNDGIVNTASMLWPTGERVLVQADHLDIVGHYRLVEVPRPQLGNRRYQPARRFQAYDSLQSEPRVSPTMFGDLWTEIFEFAMNPKAVLQAGMTHHKLARGGPADTSKSKGKIATAV